MERSRSLGQEQATAVKFKWVLRASEAGDSQTNRHRRAGALGQYEETIPARECPSRGTGSPFRNIVGSPPIMNAQ